MDKKLGNKITLGIFGGSFDPPHLGHIKLCEEFSKIITAKILVIPAKTSPFKIQKKNSVSDEHRLEMCKLAFSHIKNVEISDFEIKSDDISYTYKTIEHFLEVNPDEKICLCVGTDCLETMECWANSGFIFEKCVIVAAYREHESEHSLGEAMERLKIKYNAEIIPLLYDPIEISSSEIRYILKNGEDSL